MCAAIAFGQDFGWGVSFGANGGDNSRDLAVSGAGQSFTVGGFDGTLDLDPGPGIANYTSVGTGEDGYVVSLDASGNLEWIDVFESTDLCRVQHVEEDVSGIYLLGFYSGTMDADPGAGTMNLTATGVQDLFLIKLNHSGGLLWAKSIGGTGEELSLDLALDPMGNVLYTALFQGSVDFDPGAGVTMLVADVNGDAVVSKLNASGDFLWAGALLGGGQGLIDNSVVTADSTGNVYVAGNFYNQIDFDPGVGVSNLNSGSSSNYDIFFLKLDVSGIFQWVKQVGSTGNDESAKDIVARGTDEVYVCGSFAGTTDFDPGAGVQNLTGGGNNAAYLTRWDSNGNLIWAKMIANSVGWAEPFALAIDAFGDLYTAGYYTESADLDPGAGMLNVTASSATFPEMFMSKLDGQGNLVWGHSIGGIYSDALLGLDLDQYNNIFVTGYFWDTVDVDLSAATYNLMSNGSYDVLIAKYNQCTTQFSTDQQHSCGPFTWIDGNTYTISTTTPTFTLTANSGCDSVVTLDLTVNAPSFASDTVETCGFYFWPVIGTTYTSSGTYADTLTNISGCDSVVTLDLNVFPVPNAVISNQDNVLSTQDTGYVYQWIDCSNNQQIPGATGMTFEPSANGSYALIVSDGNCPDTSNCITVSTIQLFEMEQKALMVYPNPTHGIVTVVSAGNKIGALHLIDALGNTLISEVVEAKEYVLNMAQYAPGVYFITTETQVVSVTNY